MVGIYKITNLVNGKIYIGQSVNISERWRAHRSRPFQKNQHESNSLLHKAIRKYGLENFSFEVLEECNKEQLDTKERYYIAKYDATNLNKGYNISSGGQSGGSNTNLSKEKLNKIYDLLMNSTLTEQEIADKFSLSQRYISGINLGQYLISPNLIYPLMSNRKKIVKKFFCKKCGKEISTPTANYCIDCANIVRRTVERPTREALKNEIRNNSFLSIGKKYKVSDAAIRKWCIAYNLPSKKTEIKKFSDKEWELI